MRSSSFKILGDTLGWVGTCFSLIFYMAPAQPYSRFIRKEIQIHDVPELLLVFSYLNCVSWIPYGIRDGQAKPIVCNIIGALLTLVFIIVYCAFITNLHVKKTLFLIFVVLNLTLQFFWICYSVIRDVQSLGLICMVFNILMYAGTLEKFIRIIRTHNYHLIPILSATLMFVNGFCWFIYGLAYNDINIIIANASGVVLEGIAIGMWCYLRKKYPEIDEVGGDLVKSASQSHDEKPNNNNNDVKINEHNRGISEGTNINLSH